jgi:hypothetical protein
MIPYFFLFGFGYTAKALAPNLITQGFKVIGTSRTPDEKELKVVLNYPTYKEGLTQVWRNDFAHQ